LGMILIVRWRSIVALLIVLLLAAGCRSGKQSAVAGGGTTSIPPHLPVTVSSGGIAITLESVDVDRESTRFNLEVELPPGIAASDQPTVIDPIRDEDVQISGLIDSHLSEASQTAPHGPGLTSVPVSLTAGAIKGPNQTLTLELAKMQFVAPSNGRLVTQGPWHFTITPSMRAAQPMPTPDPHGAFTHLSMAEAQRLVDFPIIEPDPLPSVLTRKDFNVMVSTLKPEDSDKPNNVNLFYPALDESEDGIAVGETTLKEAVQAGKNGTIKMGTPPTSSGVSAKITSSTATINGFGVTKLDMTDNDVHGIDYLWQKGGVVFMVSGTVGQQVTDAVLRQMVASIIEQSDGQGTPISYVSSLLTPSAKLSAWESAT
jgi:hypothetical protein